MAFTSNINQANLQSTLQTSKEQSAEEMQSKQIASTESENKKNREFRAEQNNIAAGDKWKEDHPDIELSDEQKSNMGSDILNKYAFAQDELILGGEEMTTGKYADRVRGQDRKLRAGKTIQNLAGEYMEVEEGVADVVMDGNILPSESLEVLREISVAKANDKFDVVSANTAGETDDSTRYIRWEDENGEEKFKSVKWVKSAYENQVTRFDTNAWVEETSKNLKASRITNSDGTFKDEINGGLAIDGYVNEIMNNEKSVAALKQQFNVQDDESVKNRLTSLIDGSLKLDRSRETTASKKKTSVKKVKEIDKETAYSHRKWEVLEATGDSGVDFLTQRLEGKSAKYGEGKDKGVQSVAVDGDNLVLTYDDTTNRIVKYNNSNVNDLLNQFTYNLDETKLLWSNVATRDAVNAAADVKDTDLKPSDDFTPAGVKTALKLNINEAGGIDDAGQLKKALKTQFPELLTKENLVNSGLWDQWWNNKQLDLFGEGFNVKDKEGLAEFTEEVSEKLNILRNKKTEKTSKTYKGLDKDGNPIFE